MVIKRFLLISFFLFGVVLLNSCMQKSAYDFACEQSGLVLPPNLKLIYYENPDLARGDIYRVIEYSLTKDELMSVEKECINKGYKILLPGPKQFALFYLKDEDKGYYKFDYLSADKADYQYTVLVTNRNRLRLFYTHD